MDPKQRALNDYQSSRRRHLFGFGAVVALALMLIAMTANTFYASHSYKEANRWQMHTLRVLLVSEQTRSAVNMALRGERGFMLTGEARLLRTYNEGREAAPGRAAELRALTQDNVRQRANIAALDTEMARYLSVLDRTMKLGRSGRSAEAQRAAKGGVERGQLEAVLAALDRIEAEERRLLAQRADINARATRWMAFTDFALAGLALIFLMIVTWAGITASRSRMETLELEEKLRLAATTDELTGLLNRRAFFAALDSELARATRSGSKFALALIDLDHFKSVNDRFGHAGGDEVLRRFAEIARETMRTADVIGRIGGEEFAVLMPDTDQVQSGVAGERLREAVARRRFVLASGALVPTTISVGVAHWTAGEARDDLIARADEALYEAKESGRNRTRLAA